MWRRPAQVAELARAGSELVRITVNNEEAAAAVPLDSRPARGARHECPADRRFSFQRPPPARPNIRPAPRRWTNTASIPATSGAAGKKDEQFATIVEIACRYHKPVRIGVNWGSLDQELAARLMDENARCRNRNPPLP
jgi:(E)-4-hydroxy-3-methylbut-2-enyl-diphosphate synthase